MSKTNQSSIRYYLPVLVSLLLSAAVIVTYCVEFPNDGNIWGAFGSYVGGLVGPIISVTGFYYVIVSLNRSKVERRLDGILSFLGKIEQELDDILGKHIFVLYNHNNNTFFAEFELGDFLMFHSSVYVEKIYFDRNKTVITSLEREILEIVSYLGLVRKRLTALGQLDVDNAGNVVEYYKTKYETPIDSLTNTRDRFAAIYILNWPGRGGKYKMASDSLREITNFYTGDSA